MVRRIRGLRIRTAGMADAEAIVNLDHKTWKGGDQTSLEKISKRISNFFSGNIVAVVNNQVVGYLCLSFMNYDLDNPSSNNWFELTGDGTISTHDINGRYMFGVAMTIDPHWQQRGIGQRLIAHGWSILFLHDKEGCFLVSRVPGFAESDLDIDEYIQFKREDGKLHDYELRFWESNGFRIIAPVENYMVSDRESRNYGVLVYIPSFLHKKPQFIRKIAAYLFRSLGHLFL